MEKSYKRGLIIALYDLLIAFFAFWVSRLFEDISNWYWVLLSSVIWVVFGLITNKLYFSKYKRLRYVLTVLFFVDSLTGGMLFLFYREYVEGYSYDYSIIIATGIIFILECLLYAYVQQFVYQKIPYFYEEPPIAENLEPIKDAAVEEAINNEDANIIINAIKEVNTKSINLESLKLSKNSVVLYCSDPEVVFQCDVRTPSLIIHNKPLNMVRHINTLLSFTNYKLEENGFVVCKCVTSAIRKEKIMSQIPKPFNSIIYLFDYLNHRVIPKHLFTKNLYYWITKGKRRALTRVEVLGRLYRAGFDVVCERVVAGELYVVAKRIKEPIRHDKPTNGFFIRLKRIGKNGKIIGVYKLRTMYAYSEYLQPYIYKTEGLCNGKYANDYRVTTMGNFFRKTFLDELPMLINWAKGDMKVVGIRPLSSHFFSLYPKELQELRTKTKPGLIPPYYIIKPKTLKDKENIEFEYLNAYFKRPFRTDWSYFWRIFDSIVFKGVRGE